jgi:hypothetical protein
MGRGAGEVWCGRRVCFPCRWGCWGWPYFSTINDRVCHQFCKRLRHLSVYHLNRQIVPGPTSRVLHGPLLLRFAKAAAMVVQQG